MFSWCRYSNMPPSCLLGLEGPDANDKRPIDQIGRKSCPRGPPLAPVRDGFAVRFSSVLSGDAGFQARKAILELREIVSCLLVTATRWSESGSARGVSCAVRCMDRLFRVCPSHSIERTFESRFRLPPPARKAQPWRKRASSAIK